MIMMEQPSISFNSHDVPGPSYRMWSTVDVPEGAGASAVVWMIERYNRLALAARKSNLRNVIINCHGADASSGWLDIGGKSSVGIYSGNVGDFSALKTLNIRTIWLVACQAARDSFRQSLCRSLAIYSGALVIAGEEDQEVGVWDTLAFQAHRYLGLSNMIDDYEGLVYGFWPDGRVSTKADPMDILSSVRA